MPRPPSLSCHDLSCIRGERQLFTNLSFELEPRECLHVVGANGSGKTSLLRILCGLAEADTGEIQWQGQSSCQNTVFLQDSVYIGHKDGLKNELSAIENLRFAQNLDGSNDEPLLDQCLAQMQILNCADLATQNLSFGQRRRLAFAKLLLRSYPLWILDEPFTGIDAQGRQLIERLCVEHLQAGGMIILTHHQGLHDGPIAGYVKTLELSNQRLESSAQQGSNAKQAQPAVHNE